MVRPACRAAVFVAAVLPLLSAPFWARAAEPHKPRLVDELTLAVDAKGRVRADGEDPPLASAAEVERFLRRWYDREETIALRGRVSAVVVVRPDPDAECGVVDRVIRAWAASRFPRLRLRLAAGADQEFRRGKARKGDPLKGRPTLDVTFASRDGSAGESARASVTRGCGGQTPLDPARWEAELVRHLEAFGKTSRPRATRLTVAATGGGAVRWSLVEDVARIARGARVGRFEYRPDDGSPDLTDDDRSVHPQAPFVEGPGAREKPERVSVPPEPEPHPPTHVPPMPGTGVTRELRRPRS